MHLDDISLPQVIVSSNYDASSWKIFFCWSMQFLDKSSPFDTDDVSIESHVSHTIIDWLTHNNAHNGITLQFVSFLNVICSLFYRLCRLYCRSLLFILSFVAVRIASFFNRFLIVYHFFLSSFNSRSLSSGTDRLDSQLVTIPNPIYSYSIAIQQPFLSCSIAILSLVAI